MFLENTRRRRWRPEKGRGGGKLLAAISVEECQQVPSIKDYRTRRSIRKTVKQGYRTQLLAVLSSERKGWDVRTERVRPEGTRTSQSFVAREKIDSFQWHELLSVVTVYAFYGKMNLWLCCTTQSPCVRPLQSCVMGLLCGSRFSANPNRKLQWQVSFPWYVH